MRTKTNGGTQQMATTVEAVSASQQAQQPASTSPVAPSLPEPKLLLTIAEAAARLSIGRPMMWRLVMGGDVLSLKIGSLRRVPVAALEQYVERLSAEASRDATTDVERRSVYGKGMA